MRTLIFTDLDGTLLDHRTYSFEPAGALLRNLRHRGIPVVFCTSKTRAEVEAIRAAAGNTDPFIVENGGAVFIPAGAFGPPPAGAARVGPYDRILLGAPYGVLVTALRRIRAELGVRLRSFADMPVWEIAEATGLSLDQAELARRREFDEPFLIDEDDDASGRVAEAIAARGFRCTRGGRFLHITGDNDKGRAVRILTDLHRDQWGPVRTIALGDSPNDLSMLTAADEAILIARSDATHDPEVLRALPGVHEAGPGPAGWAAAVSALLVREVPK
jgi:mannosyl-3-phosphoglycerate phosphatase